tara:strand:+ start:4099 stop:4302 length:204 start_codon:yes stop_codon:yes gene_type:complete
MEIIKGSKEYYDYVMEYMIPNGEELYEIFTLEEDLFVDMVDTDTSYMFTDEQVEESMKANGDTLIIP